MIPLIGVVLMLLGCAGTSHTVVTLDEVANNTAVQLNLDTQLVVVLDSNPTTGYMWQLTSVDQNILKHSGNEYEPSPGAPELTGAGGQETWRFTPLAPGETTLKMQYVRSWEPNQPAREFILTVTINP